MAAASKKASLFQGNGSVTTRKDDVGEDDLYERRTGQFIYSRRIGEGSYGEVYEGVNTQTQELVAVKVAKECAKNSSLRKERMVMDSIKSPDFPKCIYYEKGKPFELDVLVMDLLGPSLYDMMVKCRGRFTLKTTLMLADQCLDRIEKLHVTGFLHCDLKPENILMGLGEIRSKKIFVVDYGLAKEYHAEKPMSIDKKVFIGTRPYMSLNAHNGVDLSRRDDLESLGYMFARFLRGNLPWQNQGGREPTRREVHAKKKEITPEMLFKGHPKCFPEYLEYCQNLAFDEIPEYAKLREMFEGEMARQNFTNDSQFDWVLLNQNENIRA